MPHPAVNVLGLVILFGFLSAWVAFGYVGMRNGSFQSQSSFGAMVFCRRLSQRVFMGATGVAMAAAGPLGFWQSMIAEQPVPATAAVISLWSIFAVLSTAVGALCIYVAGPEELHLDLERRTYRRVKGWPFFPAVRSGTWEDMAGMCTNSFWRRPNHCWRQVAARQKERDAPGNIWKTAGGKSVCTKDGVSAVFAAGELETSKSPASPGEAGLLLVFFSL